MYYIIRVDSDDSLKNKRDRIYINRIIITITIDVILLSFVFFAFHIGLIFISPRVGDNIIFAVIFVVLLITFRFFLLKSLLKNHENINDEQLTYIKVNRADDVKKALQ